MDGEWGTSDNNRRAKFYKLTAAGTANSLRELEHGQLEPSRDRDRPR